MTEYVPAPPEIDIEWPLTTDANSNYDLPMQTSFFRKTSNLPGALNKLLEIDNREDVRAIFGGCGHGAEVYGALALLVNARFAGRISMLGIDANSLAIEQANQGIYRIREGNLKSSLTFNGDRQKPLKILEHFGFKVGEPLEGERSAVYREIDANPLRTDHEVSFLCHELSEPAPVNERANLIFINNMLFFHPPKTALKIVDNLAVILEQGGVMSMVGVGTATRPAVIAQLKYEHGIKQLAATDEHLLFVRT